MKVAFASNLLAHSVPTPQGCAADTLDCARFLLALLLCVDGARKRPLARSTAMSRPAAPLFCRVAVLTSRKSLIDGIPDAWQERPDHQMPLRFHMMCWLGRCLHDRSALVLLGRRAAIISRSCRVLCFDRRCKPGMDRIPEVWHVPGHLKMPFSGRWVAGLMPLAGEFCTTFLALALATFEGDRAPRGGLRRSGSICKTARFRQWGGVL